MITVMQSNDTNAFYDAIAEYYPLFYRDWETQLEREGLSLRAIFRGRDVRRVLDAACGAGTQAVPLAKLGYEVIAADPSVGMLRKAQRTAAEHSVAPNITFMRTDFAALPSMVRGSVDAVVCKGNALPHLLTDEEIIGTLQSFYRLLRPGGVLVVGLRDFDFFMEHRPQLLPGFAHVDGDEREFITFERWEWEEGPPVIATQHLYIVQGPPEALHTIRRSVSYRPLSTEEVRVGLEECGFSDIRQYPDRWEDVLVAMKPT